MKNQLYPEMIISKANMFKTVATKKLIEKNQGFHHPILKCVKYVIIFCIYIIYTYTYTRSQKNGKVKARLVIQQDQPNKKCFQHIPYITCTSQCIIYLLECIPCNLQHIGKSETSFSIRLNNRRKDMRNPVSACVHFKKRT